MTFPKLFNINYMEDVIRKIKAKVGDAGVKLKGCRIGAKYNSFCD